jgi:hypothetical protein
MVRAQPRGRRSGGDVCSVNAVGIPLGCLSCSILGCRGYSKAMYPKHTEIKGYTKVLGTDTAVSSDKGKLINAGQRI